MKKQIFAALIALSTSELSLAESGQFSLGADIGSATHKLSVEGYDGSYDDSDTSFSFGGAFAWNQNFGVGLRYTDYGSINLSDYSGRAEVSADSLAITAIVSTNLAPKGGEWAFGGELGLARVSMDLAASIGGASGNISDTDMAFVGGIYASYGFNDHLQGVINASFTKVSIKKLDNDLSRFGLGLNYTF